jgi:hypothetical protein
MSSNRSLRIEFSFEKEQESFQHGSRQKVSVEESCYIFTGYDYAGNEKKVDLLQFHDDLIACSEGFFKLFKKQLKSNASKASSLNVYAQSFYSDSCANVGESTFRFGLYSRWGALDTLYHSNWSSQKEYNKDHPDWEGMITEKFLKAELKAYVRHWAELYL